MKRHIGIAAWTILLFSALQIAFGAGDQPDAASSYRWNAVDPTVSSGDDGKPERVDVQGMPAARFDSARKTCVDLTSRFSWSTLSGPLTLRIVFRPTRLPREKAPLVSKWQMVPGGRSFVIGVVSARRPYF